MGRGRDRTLGLQAPEPEPETVGSREAARYTAQERQDRQVEAIIQEKVKLLAAGLGSPAPTSNGCTPPISPSSATCARPCASSWVAPTSSSRRATRRVATRGASAASPSRPRAAARALGAQGVWVGTAFLATNEANVTPENKQRFIDITEEDTRVTRLFSGKTLRHPVTPLVEDWEASGLKALPMGVQGVLSNHVQLAAKRSGRGDLIYSRPARSSAWSRRSGPPPGSWKTWCAAPPT